MSAVSHPHAGGERPPNPFMGMTAFAEHVGHRQHARTSRRCDRYDRAMLDELPTLGEKVRFLRESGLELADFGLPNSIAGSSSDPDVQLYQAIVPVDEPVRRRARIRQADPDYLTTAQFKRAYNAVAFANTQGEVMTAFISISWSTVGIVEHGAVMNAQIRYLELLRKWLQHPKRDVPAAWVWVIENGRTYGLHSHILVRVPYHLKDDLAFQVETAVETIAGRPLKRKRRGMKGDRTVHVVHRRDGNVRVQWRLLRYMMKGLKPTKRERNPERWRKQVVMEKVAGLKLRRQGVVVRQRLGVSRGLSAKSRARCCTVPDLLAHALEEFGTSPEAIFTDAFYQDWLEQRHRETAEERAAENARRAAEWSGSLQI